MPITRLRQNSRRDSVGTIVFLHQMMKRHTSDYSVSTLDLRVIMWHNAIFVRWRIIQHFELL